MSAKVARGTQVRSKSRAKGSSRGSAKKAPPPGLLEGLPIGAETIRRVSVWILIGMLLALALALAAVFQIPQLIGTAAGEAIGQAGFAVKQVEIKGLNRMARLPVYNVAYDQNSMAMPLVDLQGTRERLLRFGWVEDARVYRRLPDTLVVDIIERTPSAIWQHKQQLSLIDRSGVVLEPVKLDQMPDLPLVIGPAANRHAVGLGRLLAGTPELKPMIEGATWVGGRRWDLRFQSGEVLALPEGQEAAQKALAKFARMDKSVQLLGRGLVRFDMRVPGKFIVRVSKEPGSSVPDVETRPPASAPVDGVKTI
jgi:cell division protein FtsQ